MPNIGKSPAVYYRATLFTDTSAERKRFDVPVNANADHKKPNPKIKREAKFCENGANEECTQTMEKERPRRQSEERRMGWEWLAMTADDGHGIDFER